MAARSWIRIFDYILASGASTERKEAGQVDPPPSGVHLLFTLRAQCVNQTGQRHQ